MHIGLTGNRESDWESRESKKVLGVNWRLLDEIELRVNAAFGERYAFAFIKGSVCYTDENDCRHCNSSDYKVLIESESVKRMLKSKSIDEIVQEIETEIAIYKVQ